MGTLLDVGVGPIWGRGCVLVLVDRPHLYFYPRYDAEGSRRGLFASVELLDERLGVAFHGLLRCLVRICREIARNADPQCPANATLWCTAVDQQGCRVAVCKSRMREKKMQEWMSGETWGSSHFTSGDSTATVLSSDARQ